MERIVFPEEKIPEVVAVIRAGIKTATVSAEVRRNLEKQCADLDKYWKEQQTEK